MQVLRGELLTYFYACEGKLSMLHSSCEIASVAPIDFSQENMETEDATGVYLWIAWKS